MAELVISEKNVVNISSNERYQKLDRDEESIQNDKKIVIRVISVVRAIDVIER